MCKGPEVWRAQLLQETARGLVRKAERSSRCEAQSGQGQTDTFWGVRSWGAREQHEEAGDSSLLGGPRVPSPLLRPPGFAGESSGE